MSDPLLSLNKIIATLKLNMLGEVCKVRFIDGMHIKVDSERFGFRCLGQVEKMDDEYLTIRIYTGGEDKFKSLIGMTVEISFSFEGDFYYFECPILSQADKDVIVIKKPDNIKKTQRREYLRLPIKMPLKIRRIDNQDLNMVMQETGGTGIVTKDVSGGGIRIESDTPVEQGEGIEVVLQQTLEKNSVVELEIFLPEEERTIKVLGQVAWINKVDDKYEAGITFLSVVKRDQDFIVRYILNEQIKRRKTQDIKNIRKK